MKQNVDNHWYTPSLHRIFMAEENTCSASKVCHFSYIYRFASKRYIIASVGKVTLEM